MPAQYFDKNSDPANLFGGFKLPAHRILRVSEESHGRTEAEGFARSRVDLSTSGSALTEALIRQAGGRGRAPTAAEAIPTAASGPLGGAIAIRALRDLRGQTRPRGSRTVGYVALHVRPRDDHEIVGLFCSTNNVRVIISHSLAHHTSGQAVRNDRWL
jgi:hypothetical protein